MINNSPVVGLLALQGDFQKHGEVLKRIGAAWQPVRDAGDFKKIDRLIIPGGESTVMAELLVRLSLENEFIEFVRTKPVWGTCAGMILLASQVNDGTVVPYNAIDISVDRNGYGRQVFSTTVPATLEMNGFREEFDLVFIRAPRVTRVGRKARILLEWKRDPVLLAQKNVLVSSFHPELTGSTFLHNYFTYHFGN